MIVRSLVLRDAASLLLGMWEWLLLKQRPLLDAAVASSIYKYGQNRRWPIMFLSLKKTFTLGLAIAGGGVAFSSCPAHAIDCSKASLELDKAICASPVATDADERFARFYFSRLKSLKGARHDELIGDQRAWISARKLPTKTLDVEGSHSCGSSTISMVVCLVRQYDDRRADIEARFPIAEPGESVMALDKRGKCYSLKVSVDPRLLSMSITRDEVKGALDWVSHDKCDPQGVEYETSLIVVGEKGGIIFVERNHSDSYEGAPHEFGNHTFSAYDEATGLKVEFSNLFPGIDAESPIYKQCSSGWTVD